MRKALSLYLSFARISIRSELAHRSAYWAGIVAQWLSYGATFASLYIMISTFETLAGWSAYEILLMYALSLLSYALAACVFFNPAMRLATKIRTGEFDSALTKPVSPLAHEILQGFNFGYVSHVTLSIAVIIFSLIKVKFAGSMIQLIVLLLGSVLVQSSLLLGASVGSFFMINRNPLFNFIFILKDFTNYPISIYGTFIQILLTVIVPVGFICFYPAAALLNIETRMLFPAALGYFSPLVGGVMLLCSILLWNWSVTRYQSAGS